MKNNLQSYDWIVTQGHLWDNKQITLQEIDGRTFNLLNWYSTEKLLVKQEREAIALEVQKMLGSK